MRHFRQRDHFVWGGVRFAEQGFRLPPRQAEEKAMTVRAKFKVHSIQRNYSPKSERQPDGTYKSMPGEVHTIVMQPVYANGDPNHENSKFWEASPGGRLELNCVNPEAVKQFDVGAEYYVDFTPAPKG